MQIMSWSSLSKYMPSGTFHSIAALHENVMLHGIWQGPLLELWHHMCESRAHCPMQVWLKQPLVDLAEITTRHDIVEAFTSDPMLRESLRDQHLRGALLHTSH